MLDVHIVVAAFLCQRFAFYAVTCESSQTAWNNCQLIPNFAIGSNSLTADLLHHSTLTLFHEQLLLQRCSHKASIQNFSSNATALQIASSVLSAIRQWFLLTHNLYMIKMQLNSCQRLFVCKLLWTDSLQMISSWKQHLSSLNKANPFNTPCHWEAQCCWT